MLYGPISGDLNVRTEYNYRIDGHRAIMYLGGNNSFYGNMDVADIDDDGFDDLAVSSRYATVDSSTYAGGAYIHFGPLTGSITTETYELGFFAPSSFTYVGSEVKLRDVDLDGAPDLVIGQFGWSGGGSYIFLNDSLL